MKTVRQRISHCVGVVLRVWRRTNPMAPPVTKTATTTSAVISAAEKPPPPSPTAAAPVTPFAVGRPPDASPSDAFPSPDAFPMPGASPPCFCSVGPPSRDDPPAGEIPAPNNGGFRAAHARRGLTTRTIQRQGVLLPRRAVRVHVHAVAWAITSPPPPNTPSAMATQIARRTWAAKASPARVAQTWRRVASHY